MNKLRGQGFEGAILLLVGMVIFILIAYSLLPTFGTASAFSSGQVGQVQSNGVGFNGSLLAPITSMNSLGVLVFAASILLAILGASFAVMGIFGR